MSVDEALSPSLLPLRVILCVLWVKKWGQDAWRSVWRKCGDYYTARLPNTTFSSSFIPWPSQEIFSASKNQWPIPAWGAHPMPHIFDPKSAPLGAGTEQAARISRVRSVPKPQLRSAACRPVSASSQSSGLHTHQLLLWTISPGACPGTRDQDP